LTEWVLKDDGMRVARIPEGTEFKTALRGSNAETAGSKGCVNPNNRLAMEDRRERASMF